MFTDKININILTALLLKHGIKQAVVCPGSRNAPIVHNLNACGQIKCRPVTDERSAGFYALGLSQATGQPVAVCVTSGSALLNLAPAVAEAHYQHIPLVIISADRPAAWIDQLDGQTIPQPDALGRFVKKAVNLPEVHDNTDRWLCNRLVNEALYLATYKGKAPVHINVPISEPLFHFNVSKLPDERAVSSCQTMSPDVSFLTERIREAKKPMVVIGQMKAAETSDETIDNLEHRMVVVREALSADSHNMPHFDEALALVGSDENYMPDLILYLGNTLVSKRTRHFLRQAKADTFLLTKDGSSLIDPTMSVVGIIECDDPDGVLNALTAKAGPTEFKQRWNRLLSKVNERVDSFEPKFSQMAIVKYLEEQLEDYDIPFDVHYANSSSIRLANIYARHYTWCNRGVNGIEGSLSTAAGFSLGTDDLVICVIGDLSFFYDQNALWNASLKGNLRVILLNNQCGSIFHRLKGLEQSEARDRLIAAGHHTEARGICTQNDIGYIRATTMDEARIAIVRLLTEQTKRPMVVEVLTNADDDTQTWKEYDNHIEQILKQTTYGKERMEENKGL